MEAMGDKTRARAKMIDAGVPVVPGAEGDDVEALTEASKKLGFPVMLKASAGGGGKGMRFVERAEDLAGALERARSEAKSAFGDDNVYVEKAIVRPRHIEIQILADGHGNAVHIFERDCSIQRRHQKVVEESPSPAPAATDERVAEMGAVAVRAAKAVDYCGAGTVEFLMNQDGEFYFLEMNTRLQVEHPITELTSGLDLVREQVRIAAGEPLGYDQTAITRRGHAIECRIYAEDPSTGFLPSPGTIERLRAPSGPGIRDDSGAYEGAEISSFYDPLISKLCVWAANRDDAIRRMRRALSEYVVAGIRTNIPFHLAVMSHPDFVRGDYDTGFIGAHEDVLLTSGDVGSAATELSVGAAIAQAFEDRDRMTRSQEATTPAHNGLSAWRLGALTRLR
jgi:acetyl-CoA carboxylase biotin carboxylase subunit